MTGKVDRKSLQRKEVKIQGREQINEGARSHNSVSEHVLLDSSRISQIPSLRMYSDLSPAT